MDFSELRRARERRGLSLRDIADRTKIREAILRAIENNEIDRLPPPIFTRGFVKTYAREVGLDPNDFADSLGPMLPAHGACDLEAPVDAVYEDRSEEYNFSEHDRSSAITAALIVIAGLLFILTGPWKASTPATDATTPNESEAASTHGTVVDAAVATTGGERPASQHANMRIELRPHGPCWIEATADGERVIYRLLDDGDRYADRRLRRARPQGGRSWRARLFAERIARPPARSPWPADNSSHHTREQRAVHGIVAGVGFLCVPRVHRGSSGNRR